MKVTITTKSKHGRLKCTLVDANEKVIKVIYDIDQMEQELEAGNKYAVRWYVNSTTDAEYWITVSFTPQKQDYPHTTHREYHETHVDAGGYSFKA